MGSGADTDQDDSVALGYHAYAGVSANQSVSVGSGAGSHALGATIIGFSASAASFAADHSVAIGWTTIVDSSKSVAVGANITLQNGNTFESVAIGYGITLYNGPDSGAVRSVVVGAYSACDNADAVIVGHDSGSGGANSDGNVVIGANIQPGNDSAHSVLVGYNLNVGRGPIPNSVGIGSNVRFMGSGSTTIIGSGSLAVNNALVAGYNSSALSAHTVAGGSQAGVIGSESTAVGARSAIGAFSLVLTSTVGFSAPVAPGQGDLVDDGNNNTGRVLDLQGSVLLIQLTSGNGAGLTATLVDGTNFNMGDTVNDGLGATGIIRDLKGDVFGMMIQITVTSGTWANTGIVNDTTTSATTSFNNGIQGWVFSGTINNNNTSNTTTYTSGALVEVAQTTTVGSGINAFAPNSVVIGFGAQAIIAPGAFLGGGYVTAIGSGTIASGLDAIAIGGHNPLRPGTAAQAPGDWAIAIGPATIAGQAAITSTCIAIGYKAEALGLSDCIAIGDGASAGDGVSSADCIAIGDGADARGVSCTALGESTAHGLSSCHALGGSQAGNGGSDQNITVVGESTATSGSFLYSLGDNNNLSGQYGIGIGYHNGVHGTSDCTAIGRENSLSGGNSDVIVIGHHQTFSLGTDFIAIGHNSTVGGAPTNHELIGIGRALTITGENSVAVGHSANVTGNWAVAVGNNAQATQFFAIGIGGLTEAFGLKSIAIGSDDVSTTKAHGAQSIAIGCQATDNGQDDSVAIGHTAAVTGVGGVAIGLNASAAANEVSLLNGDCNLKVGTATGIQFGNSGASKMAWWGATPVTQPTITGSQGGNAAVASLLSQLASMGLIVDATTP